MSAIAVHGLSKRFGDVVAVDRLGFEVEEGTVVGFLGPNGAGKTTTLRMLLGLVTPTAGSATIHGLPYRELPDPVRQVGALLEASGFHPAAPPATTCSWRPPPPACPRDAPTRSWPRSAWPTRPDGAWAGSRSGCASASAWPPPCSATPQVLVLDEPANGLDPQGVHWLRGFLRQLADQGRTVLVSSHVLAEVAQTVDQVVILAGGRLVTQAPLAALTDQARGAVRVRSADTGALRDLLAAHGATVELAGPDELVASGVTSQQVGRMAAAAGIAIYEMGFERANLEEVFLQLTAPQGGTS